MLTSIKKFAYIVPVIITFISCAAWQDHLRNIKNILHEANIIMW